LASRALHVCCRAMHCSAAAVFRGAEDVADQSVLRRLAHAHLYCKGTHCGVSTRALPASTHEHPYVTIQEYPLCECSARCSAVPETA
jgi:hypothetical protein